MCLHADTVIIGLLISFFFHVLHVSSNYHFPKKSRYIVVCYYLALICIGDKCTLLVSKLQPFDPNIDDSSLANDIVACPFHVTPEHVVIPTLSHFPIN